MAVYFSVCFAQRSRVFRSGAVTSVSRKYTAHSFIITDGNNRNPFSSDVSSLNHPTKTS